MQKLDTPESTPVNLINFVEQFLDNLKKSEHCEYLLNVAFQDRSQSVIHIDRQHLDQVLKNLISHTEKAVSEKAKGVIVLQLKESGNNAIIEIEDNGDGV